MADADALGTSWFRETYHRFSITRGEWLPSTWLSNGLLDAARPASSIANDLPWLESGKYLIVLLSNALLLHVAVNWVGRRLYRASYNGLHNRTVRRGWSSMVWIDKIPQIFLVIFPRQIRLLMGKDLRLFRRDPVQWSQFLIFFGLLLLYFVNVDRFRQHKTDISALTWVNIISFLNLAVVGLILSTFTTRFIYPLISLEGRRFWILSLLPVERDTILWGKFLFAACGSWLPCASLVLISDWMLEVDRMVIGVHQFICLLLSLGLAGMAVGLGAMMPNFHEQSPSKIAAGFGGTLNLVLSALYIMAVVLMTAMPCHFYLLASTADVSLQWARPHGLRLWMGLGMGGSLLLAILVTLIPLTVWSQSISKTGSVRKAESESRGGFQRTCATGSKASGLCGDKVLRSKRDMKWKNSGFQRAQSRGRQLVGLAQGTYNHPDRGPNACSPKGRCPRQQIARPWIRILYPCPLSPVIAATNRLPIGHCVSAPSTT